MTPLKHVKAAIKLAWREFLGSKIAGYEGRLGKLQNGFPLFIEILY